MEFHPPCPAGTKCLSIAPFSAPETPRPAWRLPNDLRIEKSQPMCNGQRRCALGLGASGLEVDAGFKD
jgi:hypothetical protein